MSETDFEAGSFVTGPHRVDQPHPELASALADLLGRVTVAGGATGFTPTTELDSISELTQQIVDDAAARPRRRHVLTIGREHSLAGAVVLKPNTLPVQQDRAEIEWIAVDPNLQGSGWGSTLLDAAVSHAQALGLSRLYLFTRSGQDLERFYTSRGWTESGRWLNALRVSAEDLRDQLWFTREV